MTERWIAVSVRLFEQRHPLFPTASDPACRLFAWLDLIRLAEWKDTGILKRGQLKYSQRFLSVRWFRSVGWVNRLLRDFAQENQISRTRNASHREHDPDVITICNYEKWQMVGRGVVNAEEHTSGYTNGYTAGHKSLPSTIVPRTKKTTVPNGTAGNGNTAWEVAQHYQSVWTARFEGVPEVGLLFKMLGPLETTSGREKTLKRWTNLVGGLDPRYFGNGDPVRNALLKLTRAPAVYDNPDWNMSDRDKAELSKLTDGLFG